MISNYENYGPFVPLVKHGTQNILISDITRHNYDEYFNGILNIMRDGIAEILNKYTVTKIVVEEVRPEGGYGVGNTKTHRALMWLQAATAFLIHDNYSSIEIEYIYPSSWRAALGIKNGRGIKRTSLKEQDIQYVQEKYNIKVNDDEADAICIGLSQYKEKDNNEINWGE